MPGVRRSVLVITAVVAVARPVPAGGAAVPVLVIEGRGHGHGVGMAQDGAYWMGRNGAGTSQILSHFYPGTRLGRAGGEVRVAVLAGGPAVALAFPTGGEVRDARDGGQSTGFPLRVPAGGRAVLRFDGRQYTAEVAGGRVAAPAPASSRGTLAAAAAGAAAQTQPTPPVDPAQATTTTTATPGLLPAPGSGKPLLPLPSAPLPTLPTVPTVSTTTTTRPASTAPPPTGPARVSSARALWGVPSGGGTVDVVERGNRYRGVIQAVAGGGGLRLVNHVDVEQYLRGMGEVRDPGWPAASLRAQAIAARTYALRAMAGGGELCDTQQCQVYLGAQAEYGAMDRAVSATRGQVLYFGRGLASTVYSANGGGFSASTEEGFGTPGAGYPYLRPARYATGEPFTWTVTVSLRDVAARVGYRGRVSAVRTVAGPSGRALQVVVEGNRGARTVSGIDFDRALGLKSTMFTVKTGEAASAPAPPPADPGAVQGLPAAGDAAAPVEAAQPVDEPGAPATPLAVAAPVVTETDTRSRVVLGALAWLLLTAVGGAAAAVRLGGPGRAGREPAPETAAEPSG